MRLLIEVSTGELIDKITILEIKLDKIADAAKRANVAREYAALNDVLVRDVAASHEIERLRRELKAVNLELWTIEDEIRAEERAQRFGPAFIALSRSVYHKNDHRARLKRQINQITESYIVEEKSYSTY